MSFKLVNDLWTRDVGGTTQSVLFVLCDQANDFGECWPSQKLIAWKLGISNRTVIRVVQKLEAQGVLSVRRKFQSSNRYTIDLTKLPEKPPFKKDGQDVTYGDDISDTAMSPQEVTPDVTTEVTHMSPKPSVTPQTESSSSATTPQWEERFNRWYSTYPRKQAKGDAKKAWQKINPDDGLVAEMVAAVERQKRTQDWQKDGGKYIPLPASWLRAERWLDEVGDVAPSSTPGVPRYAEVSDPYEAQIQAYLRKLEEGDS
jgi:biotin operon repressor